MSDRPFPANFQVFFGPPGTGKTTKLSSLVARYAEYEGADSLLLTSFTRAAAQELLGRDLPVPTRNIGTLHSHCFQGLDRPVIAEGKFREWNTAFPRYAMTVAAVSLHDASSLYGRVPEDQQSEAGELLGDKMLDAYNLARARCVPQQTYPHHALSEFVRAYEDWKSQHGYLDYTDLLVHSLELLHIAPGNPRTIVVDEAQDLTPLHWAIITQWSRHAKRTIAGGDDDQCLYAHVGADPGVLLATPDDQKSVLPVSYRLPQQVYTYAHKHLDAMTVREPKAWTHNGQRGEVSSLYSASWRRPATLLPLIERVLATSGKTLMLLAPASYQLTSLVAMLRREGIPFANPWRRRRGDWNPLYYAGKGISSVLRLMDFLRPPSRLWTWRELASWAGILRKRGNLLPAAETLLTVHGDEDRECPLASLEEIFTPEALAGALRGGLRWFETRTLKQYATGMQFPLRVYQRYGRKGLSDDPRVTIGTCHSVKGGEADTVVLFTDLPKMFQQARSSGGQAADAVERMLYVGATRARETLYVA